MTGMFILYLQRFQHKKYIQAVIEGCADIGDASFAIDGPSTSARFQAPASQRTSNVQAGELRNQPNSADPPNAGDRQTTFFRCRMEFVIPSAPFEKCRITQNVSDGVTNPVALWGFDNPDVSILTSILSKWLSLASNTSVPKGAGIIALLCCGSFIVADWYG